VSTGWRPRPASHFLALAEFPDPEHPAHQQAVVLKRWVRDRLGDLTAELAKTAPIGDPDLLADHLALLIEGVYASAQALDATGPAQRPSPVSPTIGSASWASPTSTGATSGPPSTASPRRR
jgi:hypothetical protein